MYFVHLFRKRLRREISENKARVYIHSPYTLNPSNRIVRNGDSEVPWVCEKFVYLLHLGAECGLKGIVIHCGKIGGLDEKTALFNMFSTVVLVARHASNNCPLLIETSAAQTAELLSNLDEFIWFWLALPPEAQKTVKMCIDTCHVFAAGYDPAEFLEKTLESGVPVGLIHYNDSKLPKNSHRDRHASIGNGYIGIVPLMNVLNTASRLFIDCVHE